MLGAFFAFIAVLLGAMGAHLLKDNLSVDSLKSFETGVKYLMYHALYLLFLSVYVNKENGKAIKNLLYLTTIGILFFSGSIFLLSTISITKIEVFRLLGPITPVGGLLLILNWALLFYYAFIIKIFKD
jgi:uncharacterized membrane protein YgdD (TMEM256/DUF423 family)